MAERHCSSSSVRVEQDAACPQFVAAPRKIDVHRLFLLVVVLLVLAVVVLAVGVLAVVVFLLLAVVLLLPARGTDVLEPGGDPLVGFRAVWRVLDQTREHAALAGARIRRATGSNPLV